MTCMPCFVLTSCFLGLLKVVFLVVPYSREKECFQNFLEMRWSQVNQFNILIVPNYNA